MIAIIATAIACFIVGGILSYILFRYVLKSKYDNVLKEAETEAEVIKKNKLLEVKEKFLNKKADLEKEVALRNQKIQQAENKLKQREMVLSQRQEEIQRKKLEAEAVKENLEAQLVIVDKKKDELDKLQQQEIDKLEAISGLSAEEAKERLVESLKEEAKTQAQSFINDIMDDAKLTASKEAKRIVIQSIQRVATETAIENSVTVFHIESDEIKGRIIGREGRNIRTLESLTGIDVIIDDTPEVVVLSGFDPIRREIARMTLEALIQDGRIHPARIEELVEKNRLEMDNRIREYGEAAAFEIGAVNLHPDLIKIMGRLQFRTSYGQNVLRHSVEVGKMAGILASELGENVMLARRAGFLHDMGKAIDREVEGSHVEIGAEFARKYKENPIVVNAIASHHGDVEPESVIAVIVAAADALSSARPGARNESMENYIKRLRDLEEIAKSFDGVQNSYALQAGREIRIMVQPNKISDDEVTIIAHKVREKIENNLDYPGNIKVTVIRELRAVDYAK